MAERVTHLAGNALTTPWPRNQDVVLMSYVWSAVGGNDIRTLASRALEALKPGGIVLVHDFMVDDDHEGPAFAAWYLLASLPDNPDAECLSPGFVERCLGDAGFAVDGTEPMLSEITALTRGCRPRSLLQLHAGHAHQPVGHRLEAFQPVGVRDQVSAGGRGR